MNVPFQTQTVPVGPALSLVLEFSLAGLQAAVSFQIVSAAGSATTNDFVILRKLHDAGDWLPYLGGTDFAVATSKCIASTPGPQNLPGGSSAWVDVDCGAAVAVQLWASVAAGSASLSIFGGARTR